jgi:hypothetical protein
MATGKQQAAARRNVRKAIDAAKRKRTISRMPRSTRRALGQQAAAVRQRRRTGQATPRTRQELYEMAKRRGIPGRSRMGRAELARALGER